MRLVAAEECRRVRWKNDGGWTTELARSGPVAGDDDDAFRWRVSIAEIESDGPFSSFPGIQRDLLLLAGNGIELCIGGRPPLRLERRFERAHFDGAEPAHCRLLAGPTRDFNVMTRCGTVRADIVARPLVGSMVIFPEAGAEWFVHALAGEAKVRSGGGERVLETGASLHLDCRDGSTDRVLLNGGGELVLVKFTAP